MLKCYMDAKYYVSEKLFQMKILKKMRLYILLHYNLQTLKILTNPLKKEID